MKKEIEITVSDLNAEDRIKQSASSLFAKHGFSGTKTRDIAKDAGINLALLNYYFRSKENLFALIMLDAMRHFFEGLSGILNNEALSLEEKLFKVVENYTKVFLQQPDLPFFVLTEMRKDPAKMEAHLGIKKVILQSHFYKQLKLAAPKKVNPFQFLINLMGLSIFPFMAAPMLKILGDLNEKEFQKLVSERKKLIPLWICQQLQILEN